MTEHILFVFEGEKTESNILKNLVSYFLNEDDRFIIKAAYKTDIYRLYQQFSEDDELDLFTILKEKNEELKDFTSKMFSQIYLFFDYDGHIDRASNEKVNELLKFFNEETDKGKLYISYPMVEAIKCFRSSDATADFKDFSYTIPNGTDFKHYVSQYVHPKCLHFHTYTLDDWNLMLSLNLKKYNWITVDQYDLIFDELCQIKLLEKQIEKFITPMKTVSVIASFPIMLIEFYGKSRFEGLL